MELSQAINRNDEVGIQSGRGWLDTNDAFKTKNTSC